MPELQSGCEITAANIVLNYLGYQASKADLLKYLPVSNDFRTVSGKKYGPNPWKAFAGSPDTARYGCYSPVIANTINEYLLNQGGSHTAYSFTGVPADRLYSCIDAGVPVIVWVTSGMQEPAAGDGWYLADSGAYCQWVSREHCMVLIGYNEDQAIFCDPLDSRESVSYGKALFTKRYEALFSQAVAAVPS
ncbi:MAG: C39 family peptidase [Oscillospiraceae bacterium]|mgnify:CR=1 FL=1|jgi:uncharacterized protein YvpB|nr:C39 family peptidase [Oscillospiraceae bacterium]MCI1991211.1 C39 family peptidase [Oscillospiraceae bacterium]MCI2036216.1 C39 family peptidase [Oscillospiraceae bacterium]